MVIRQQLDIRIGGRRIRLGQRTLLMGILNVTPDSFSDGGKFFEPGVALEYGLEMARSGADWIDVGGESTRPGALPVAAEEEKRRVIPVIEQLHKRLPSVAISIDTTKAEVAEKAMQSGASVINDASGLRFDERIASVAREFEGPLILMHIRGTPRDMQQRPFVQDIWKALNQGLGWSIRKALKMGLDRGQLILDPGLGFGKSRRQNYEILAGLARLRRFNLPLCVGSSRKSFIQAIVRGEGLQTLRPLLPSNPGARKQDDVLSCLAEGDAAAVTAAILGGAHIVRVHDVASTQAAARVADAVQASVKPEYSFDGLRNKSSGRR
jgi:dihydropteroate synthase